MIFLFYFRKTFQKTRTTVYPVEDDRPDDVNLALTSEEEDDENDVWTAEDMKFLDDEKKRNDFSHSRLARIQEEEDDRAVLREYVIKSFINEKIAI